MQVLEYEKALLGLMLANPNGTGRIPERVTAELSDDKFSNNHKRIYKAIANLVLKNEIPNTLNVCHELGPSLENCGGIEYLESLTKFPYLLGITEPKGYETWIRVIDNSGRLRHFGLVLNEYHQMYDDFERLIQNVKDVDEFLSNFMSKVNTLNLSSRSSYRHIGEIINENTPYFNAQGAGNVVDLIPCGWPSLEKYQIPRPGSFGSIMGLSSMGKTSFALQMILGVALQLYNNNQEGVVTINSLETRAKRLDERLACILSRTNSIDLAHGTLSKEQFNKFMESREFISQLPIYVDDNPSITTDQFAWQAIALHTHKKRVLGISDYAELFKDKGDTEEQRVSSVVRNQRIVSWELNSCECLLSQFNNTVMRSGTKIGSLADARYSGAFEHALDWGIILWNPKQMRARNINAMVPDGKRDDMAYAFVQKNKEYPVGEIEFEWYPEFRTFRDTSLPLGLLFREKTELVEF